VLGDLKIERVIHAAVITPDSVRESSEPKEIIGVNIQGTANVLDAARTAGCRRVLCVSSGAAYGKALYGPGPLREEISASLPETIYGITKFAAEQIALRLGSLWGLNVVCVRLGSVFGPWEFDTRVRDRLSPQFQLAQLAVRGETALLPGQEVQRDWVYSRDVASGLVRILKAVDPRYTYYHLGSGVKWQHAILDWCEELRRAYPKFSWRVATSAEKPNINYHADRDRATMDISRLVNDIGFMPKFVEQDAHDDYIGWILKNQGFMNFELSP
jgi:UDP-glucuronate 4-epimerase